MMPMLEILAAYGVYALIQLIQKRYRFFVAIVIAVLYLANVCYFFHQYFIHASIHRNWYRNEGFDTMMQAIQKAYSTYDHIIITKSAGGIYQLVLFYAQFDPKKYFASGAHKDMEYTGFGKYFFVLQPCPSIDRDDKFPKGKVLYVDNGTCPTTTIRHTDIFRLDGTKVFRIVYD